MTNGFLPCPFCEGTDIRIDKHHCTDRSRTEKFVYSMCCYSCGATFPNRYKPELLREAWNRRPHPTPGSELSGAEQTPKDAVMYSKYSDQELITEADCVARVSSLPFNDCALIAELSVRLTAMLAASPSPNPNAGEGK